MSQTVELADAPSQHSFPELGAARERAGALIGNLHGAGEVQNLRMPADWYKAKGKD